jgi:hypothetical protein
MIRFLVVVLTHRAFVSQFHEDRDLRIYRESIGRLHVG